MFSLVLLYFIFSLDLNTLITIYSILDLKFIIFDTNIYNVESLIALKI